MHGSGEKRCDTRLWADLMEIWSEESTLVEGTWLIVTKSDPRSRNCIKNHTRLIHDITVHQTPKSSLIHVHGSFGGGAQQKIFGEMRQRRCLIVDILQNIFLKRRKNLAQVCRDTKVNAFSFWVQHTSAKEPRNPLCRKSTVQTLSNMNSSLGEGRQNVLPTAAVSRFRSPSRIACQIGPLLERNQQSQIEFFYFASVTCGKSKNQLCWCNEVCGSVRITIGHLCLPKRRVKATAESIHASGAGMLFTLLALK